MKTLVTGFGETRITLSSILQISRRIISPLLAFWMGFRKADTIGTLRPWRLVRRGSMNLSSEKAHDTSQARATCVWSNSDAWLALGRLTPSFLNPLHWFLFHNSDEGDCSSIRYQGPITSGTQQRLLVKATFLSLSAQTNPLHPFSLPALAPPSPFTLSLCITLHFPRSREYLPAGSSGSHSDLTLQRQEFQRD